jgi:hypothetical protein
MRIIAVQKYQGIKQGMVLGHFEEAMAERTNLKS